MQWVQLSIDRRNSDGDWPPRKALSASSRNLLVKNLTWVFDQAVVSQITPGLW